jgi:phage-related protein
MATNVQIKQENENNYLEFDNHVIFTYINQWENHSISKIQLAAQQARNDLKQLFTKNRQDFINLLNQVNKEVDENLNTSNNLTKCTEQLNKLQKDLSNMSSYIHLEHDKTKSPIYLIKLFHKNKNQTKQIDNDTVIHKNLFFCEIFVCFFIL